jgi:hypothetical protein
MDGKKPIFIDKTDSTFFFPNLHVRFLEIPNAEVAKHLATAGSMPGNVPGGAPYARAGESATLDPDQRLPIALGDGGMTIDTEPDGAAEPEPEIDLDIDEDFLQRVRDI